MIRFISSPPALKNLKKSDWDNVSRTYILENSTKSIFVPNGVFPTGQSTPL